MAKAKLEETGSSSRDMQSRARGRKQKMVDTTRLSLEDEPYKDFSVHVGHGDSLKTFKLHSIVLETNSNFFDSATDSSNPPTEIHIRDMDEDIFHVVLDWLYGDDLDTAIQRNLDSKFAMVWDGFFQHIFMAAFTLSIPKLIDEAFKYIIDDLATGTSPVGKLRTLRFVKSVYVMATENGVEISSKSVRSKIKEIHTHFFPLFQEHGMVP